MTLHVKKGGSWNEISALKVKINGEWKDISTLYSKKDGAWVTVYSSGALITFTNYPYPIPVAAGWKYSTDKTNWTTAETDGTINDSGTFTGWVKAKDITLNEFYTSSVAAQENLMRVGPEITYQYYATAFANNGICYICGGAGHGTAYISTINKFDANGNLSTATLETARTKATSFVNNNNGYVCSGDGDGGRLTQVEIFNSSGVRTATKYLNYGRRYASSFVIGGKGYVCGGGTDSSAATTSVETIDSSNVVSSATSLSAARSMHTSFSNGVNGYVCGGYGTSSDTKYKSTDKYDGSGNLTTGPELRIAASHAQALVINDTGYVLGGLNASKRATNSGSQILKTGVVWSFSLFKSVYGHCCFTTGQKGYFCGGIMDSGTYIPDITIIDSSENKTTGSLSVGKTDAGAAYNGSIGVVCGGYNSSLSPSVLRNSDIFYDIPESYSTKLPITEGSTYTLNGTTATAGASQILSFNSKVSGTIKYKKGTVPSS